METLSESTTQQGEFKTHETLHPFLWAGNATFTLVSKKSGKRFTYKITKAKFKTVNADNYYVSVLNGPDNQFNYAYMGIFNLVSQKLRVTQNSAVKTDAPSFILFIWFVHQLFSNPEKLFQQAELYHEGKCGRCGRKLTVPESIESGFGPECASKL